jgi:hypothetical protein
VEHVVVTIHGVTEKVTVEVTWMGGHRTQSTLRHPVACLEQLSYYPALVQCIMTLHTQGLHAPAMAQTLNEEG